MTETVRPADDVAGHIADTTDAHDASAISFSPTGTISSTDVQAAIAEVASEAGGGPFEFTGSDAKFSDPLGASLLSNDSTVYLMLAGPDVIRLVNGTMQLRLEDGKAFIESDYGVVLPNVSEPAGGDSENGQIIYDADTDKFRAYENGAWTDMIGGGSSHTHVYSEVPSGTVNGSNDTFTLAATPTSGTLRLYKNGLRQKAGAGNDYTLATATITFLTGNIPQTGDNLLADYNS